jgi:hypothetical protein
VEYLLSGMRGQALREELPQEEFRERVSGFRYRLERELTRRGPIHITKDTGMFVASS